MRDPDQRMVVQIPRIATLIFGPLAVIACLVMTLLYFNQATKDRAARQLGQEKVAEIGQSVFAQRLGDLASDAGFLSEGETLQRWLGSGNQDDLHALERQYLAFARRKVEYDQVRFIDLSGEERVRVDHAEGGSSLVQPGALQNKLDRFYVADTLKLARGEIYFSRFDLNVEQGKIEQPIKPMIRVATPAYDAQGRERGLVVLNYRGQEILSRVRQLGAQVGGDTWLVDDNGYWMLGPSAADEWGFMSPAHNDRTFAQAFPSAWQRMQKGGSARFAEEGTLFAYSTIVAKTGADRAGSAAPPALKWYLVSHIAPAAQPPILTGQFLLGGGVVLALLAALSMIAATYRVRRARARSEIDLLNRRLAHSEKMEALGQLTGGVAHDFNNLLAVIIGNAEILAGQIDDLELRSMAEMVMTSAEGGSVLTDRLLTIGRRQALHPVDLDIGDVVRSLAPTLHRTLGDGIVLNTAVEVAGRIRVDRSQFESALVNLALNARAAMQAGGVFTISSKIVPAPEAIHGEAASSSCVRVSLSDTGIGMSAETAANVFDPFFTTKKFGAGAGMGLAPSTVLPGNRMATPSSRASRAAELPFISTPARKGESRDRCCVGGGPVDNPAESPAAAGLRGF